MPSAVSLGGLLMLACSGAALAAGCPVPLLTLDGSGEVLAGSRTALRAAAERGDDLRVGFTVSWGKGVDDRVMHWADAQFVTVFEQETFAQIAPIHVQHPRAGAAHVVLSDQPRQWHASIGSNGRLVGRMGSDAPTELRVAQQWCLTGSAAARCTVPAWRLLYHHDADGHATDGSKKVLLDAVRRGDPIRVAWGFAGPDGSVSVEHSADAVFLSIAGGREVYAQLAEHAKQHRYHLPGEAAMEDPNLLWRGVLGTDGRFDAAWSDRSDGEPATRLPQRAALRWLAFAPDPACDPRPVPVLAVPGGVRRAP